MGEVVSFAKARQTDIFSMFDTACPSLPEEINREVVDTAVRSVGERKLDKPASFRAACLLIAAVSVCGIALSFFSDSDAERLAGLSNGQGSNAANDVVSSKNRNPVEGAFSSNIVVTEEFTLDHLQSDDISWRHSRETWLAHIAAMEGHPHYQQVLREKRLFSLTHPDQSE